jgi:chemotaxis protein MotB
MRSPAIPARPAAGAAHGDGDYFASMTDLMLGLVFVFIIMLMAFSLNLRQAEQSITTVTHELTDADLVRSDMLHDLARTLQHVLPVTVDDTDGTLQLGGDVLFPKGSADAYPDALPKLQLLGYALARVLPCYAVTPQTPPPARCTNKRQGRLDAVYIEGHTDDTPVHTARFQNNWELSAARASQTYAALVGDDPSLAQLENDKGERLIGVSGYGDTRPLDQADTAAGRQRNRRIELRFIMVAPKADADDSAKPAAPTPANLSPAGPEP